MSKIKIKYDETTPQENCLAYVDSMGVLVILDQTSKNEAMSVYQSLGIEGKPIVVRDVSWLPEYAERYFYKGDTIKITITF